jgi:hypothetical protein
LLNDEPIVVISWVEDDDFWVDMADDVILEEIDDDIDDIIWLAEEISWPPAWEKVRLLPVF